MRKRSPCMADAIDKCRIVNGQLAQGHHNECQHWAVEPAWIRSILISMLLHPIVTGNPISLSSGIATLTGLNLGLSIDIAPEQKLIHLVKGSNLLGPRGSLAAKVNMPTKPILLKIW